MFSVGIFLCAETMGQLSEFPPVSRLGSFLSEKKHKTHGRMKGRHLQGDVQRRIGGFCQTKEIPKSRNDLSVHYGLRPCRTAQSHGSCKTMPRLGVNMLVLKKGAVGVMYVLYI